MKDVFISYKTEDVDEASWVKSTLETNGITCWMAPSCIPGGSSYALEIPQAIKQAKVFVLILSAKAQSSQWVSKEVDLAINEGKIILPFMLENCALKDDFNFYLTNVQRYTAYENKVAAIEKMLKEIKALTGRANEELPVEEKEKEVEIENVQISDKKPNINKLCLLSMILGIISAVSVGLLILPNIAAIIFAIIGANKVKKESSAGKKFAITGLILSVISNMIGFSIYFSGVGFIISLLIAGISIPLFFIKSKSKAI